MSKLLTAESPLQVLPSLAAAIGLNESIVLQQIHYWLVTKPKIYQGKPWVYNSATEWQQQFPFWSVSTIRRILDNLRDANILEVDNFNSNPQDRTLWYTINYNNIPCETTPEPFTQVEQMPVVHIVNLSKPSTQIEQMQVVNLDKSYRTEINTETNSRDDAHASDASAHLEPEQPAAPTAPLSQKRLVNAFGRPIDGPEIVLDDLPSGPKSATPAKNVKVYHRAAVARFDPRKIRADGLIDKGQGANELEIWLEGFPQKPTEAQMRDMREKVPPEKYDRWREVIQETSIQGFKSYQNVMDVFLNGWRNGSKPPSHPTVSAKKVEFAIAGLL